MKHKLILGLALIAMVMTSVAPSQAFMRASRSLASDAKSAPPVVPDFTSSLLGGPIKKDVKKVKLKKAVDPLKLIRNKLIAGKKVTDKELERLADSGDSLGQFYYAKRLEERGTPEDLKLAAGYYLLALENKRESAIRPVVRMLDEGVFADDEKKLDRSKTVLEANAADGNVLARDALIRMYRSGTPFGADPEHADALLAMAADGGDSKAAFDLAVALLSGVPEPDEVEKAKGYLKIASAAEELNIRTMAENLLRTLEPEAVAAVTETQS